MKNATPSGTTPTPLLAPRPTMFEGVLMRSRLEAAFAVWADSCGVVIEYEPAAFAGSAGQYLPDFLLRYVDVEDVARPSLYESAVYVEVKPFLPKDLDAVTARMEIIRESIPDAVLAIAYQQPEPGLLVKRRSLSWAPAVWTYGARLGGGMGIAFPVRREDGPWPDGYWKGPKA